MKKLVFIFSLILTMLACSSNKTSTNSSNDSTFIDSIDTIDSAMVDTIHFEQ